jgi:hypothetical protein
MPTIHLSRKARRGLLGGTALVLAAGGALAAAPTASAYSVITAPVSCSAVNVRSNHSASSTALGVGYRNDSDRISKVYYNHPKTPNLETDAWVYGTVTRHSDGRKVTGWVVSYCINFRA